MIVLTFMKEDIVRGKQWCTSQELLGPLQLSGITYMMSPTRYIQSIGERVMFKKSRKEINQVAAQAGKASTSVASIGSIALDA